MKAAEFPTRAIERRRWSIRGQVQGVGFRPFVYRLAQELHLAGLVRNDSSAVTIEAQGSAAALDEFAVRLTAELPALARIDEMSAIEITLNRESAFTIIASQPDQQHRPVVTSDSAVCPDCLHEMSDPADFRFGYGLINCTNCGPRYSIIRAMPYDRASTTMVHFALCEKCHNQYLDPADRRFHAQPVACAVCGPKVELFDLGSAASDSEDPIRKAADLLAAGGIIAIKGIGGFHLACRADAPVAIAELRRRKHRDAKPFAIMCANLQAVTELVELSEEAQQALTSPAAPIVLATRKMQDSPSLDLIAPGTHRLGVLLPYTPIHHLLFAALAQNSTISALVMTSANVSDEPLVKDNDEAAKRLAGIADAILWHDRGIERCVDDSIVLDLGPGQMPLPIRRARGYVPQVLRLPASNQGFHGLCVGGELKNTVAVVRGDEVILSQHLGDLKHALAYQYFQKAIDDLCRLMEVKPAWIAHDLHPAYLSTQWASQLAARWGVPLIPVQHHHAHAAAVLAEHDITEPALAVVCDGVGYGTDTTAWGGELLALRGGDFQRLGHLRPILLPGGDAAAKDTRRCAAGLLWGMHQGGVCESFHHRLQSLFVDTFDCELVAGMLRSGTGCVTSSAAGRVFDAMAGLLGACMSNDHEAQAPMALEALAAGATEIRFNESGRMSLACEGEMLLVDLFPAIARMLGSLEAGQSKAELAAQFHEDFAQAWAEVVVTAAQRTGIHVVGLSGGVFCNALLTLRLSQLLSERGMRVLRHQLVPPNDGGVSFGQAAVVARKERALCA